MKNLILITCAGAALAACASTPQHDDQLEAARAEVRQLGEEPLAHDTADRDLQAARRALQDADEALQNRRPLTEVHHHAYLAQRHAEAGEARVRGAAAQAQLARAQDERNRILLAQRSAEAQRSRAQAEERTAEAQQSRAQAESAQSQLAQAQQELQDLKAKQTDRGTVVTLGDVLFDTAGATLKPGADLSLDRLAGYLRAHPDTRLRIEGHTDSRGSDEYNDALSQRRADAVARALERRGVPADSLEALGRGKSYPVATNDTPAGRQQNRRVEIVFSDSAGRFAQGEAPTRR